MPPGSLKASVIKPLTVTAWDYIIMVDMISLLIINPNTTESMTDALKPLISGLHYSDVSLFV